MPRRLLTLMVVTLTVVWLTACGAAHRTPAAGDGTTLAPEGQTGTDATRTEVVLYDYAEDIPQEVLEAFTAETGLRVRYEAYDSYDEALETLSSDRAYDLVVIGDDYVPLLTDEGALRPIDFSRVPNFRHIGPTFRDLAFDPGNRYSVPFNWGTTGMLVRSDLTAPQPSEWADLFSEDSRLRFALRRDEGRENVGVVLKSLGHSLNSEDPGELAAAQGRLEAARDRITLVESYAEVATPPLVAGEVQVLVGWAEDALEVEGAGVPISYVLPADGPPMWGDSFVLPASGANPAGAALLLDYLLRPDVAAAIVNQNYYATANETALPLIDPEIADNPAIFPANEDLVEAEAYLPLPPEVEALHLKTWQTFLDGGR